MFFGFALGGAIATSITIRDTQKAIKTGVLESNNKRYEVRLIEEKGWHTIDANSVETKELQ